MTSAPGAVAVFDPDEHGNLPVGLHLILGVIGPCLNRGAPSSIRGEFVGSMIHRADRLGTNGRDRAGARAYLAARARSTRDKTDQGLLSWPLTAPAGKSVVWTFT